MSLLRNKYIREYATRLPIVAVPVPTLTVAACIIGRRTGVSGLRKPAA